MRYFFCKRVSVLAFGLLLAFVGPHLLASAAIPNPEAVIIFEGGQERIVIKLDNTARTDGNFYKIIAVPDKPQLSSAPADFWTRVQAAAEPKNYLGQLFGDVFRTVGGPGSSGKAGPIITTPGRIGDFEVTTLKASSSADLQSQATAQGFGGAALDSPLVAEYIAKNEYFVLIKTSGQAAPPTQTLVISFATSQPIYPARLVSPSPPNTTDRPLILLSADGLLQPDNSSLTTTFARQLGSGEKQDLVRGLGGSFGDDDFFLSTISSKISDSETAQADLTFKATTNRDEIGRPALNLAEWPLAVIGTLLYGDIALAIVLWKLFSSDLIGIITAVGFAVLIGGFLRPKRARPITLLVLAVVHLIFVLAICLSVIGYDSGLTIVLLSLLPGLGLIVWATLGLIKSFQRRDAETQRNAEVLN